MLIDCDSCVGRGSACGGCVLSVMLGAPPEGVQLDEDERTALAVLADGGLLPPLRLLPATAPDPVVPGRSTASGAGGRGRRAAG